MRKLFRGKNFNFFFGGGGGGGGGMLDIPLLIGGKR